MCVLPLVCARVLSPFRVCPCIRAAKCRRWCDRLRAQLHMPFRLVRSMLRGQTRGLRSRISVIPMMAMCTPSQTPPQRSTSPRVQIASGRTAAHSVWYVCPTPHRTQRFVPICEWHSRKVPSRSSSRSAATQLSRRLESVASPTWWPPTTRAMSLLAHAWSWQRTMTQNILRIRTRPTLEPQTRRSHVHFSLKLSRSSKIGY
mmetsp:Transcript_5348/g.16368  ORF Transcript_5348/g.16368 Transcript_5348/m.16368 type:complete len:202 (+) Transcript_5348:109-714(+)